PLPETCAVTKGKEGVLILPSWPRLFAPQQRILSSTWRAQLWVSPAVKASTSRSGTGVKPVAGVAVNTVATVVWFSWFVVVPLPICRLPFRPQQRTPPSAGRAQL